MRRLGEFLDELEVGSKLPFGPVTHVQGTAQVRTPGFGFRVASDAIAARQGALRLGGGTYAVLAELDIAAAEQQTLHERGVVQSATTDRY